MQFSYFLKIELRKICPKKMRKNGTDIDDTNKKLNTF